MITIRIRFLDEIFRGRTHTRNAEWPPSPERLFSALVAGAAAENILHTPDGIEALTAVEHSSAPIIGTSTVRVSTEEQVVTYTAYKPDATPLEGTKQKWKPNKSTLEGVWKRPQASTYPTVTRCRDVRFLCKVDEKYAPILDQAARGISYFGSAGDTAEVMVSAGNQLGFMPQRWRPIADARGETRLWYPGLLGFLNARWDAGGNVGANVPLAPSSCATYVLVGEKTNKESSLIPLTFEQALTHFEKIDDIVSHGQKVAGSQVIPLVRGDVRYGDGALLGIATMEDGASKILRDPDLGLSYNPNDERIWTQPDRYVGPAQLWRSVLPAMLPADLELARAMARYELESVGCELLSIAMVRRHDKGCAPQTRKKNGSHGYALAVYSPIGARPNTSSLGLLVPAEG